jgi:hypothetical protein
VNPAAMLSKIFLTAFIIIVIITSPITANLSSVGIGYAEQEQISHNSDSGKINKEKLKDNKKGVFYTLTSLSSSNEGNMPTLLTTSNSVHEIEMIVVTLPSGLPAYKMMSHVKSNGLSSSDVASNSNSIDLTPKYSKLATIPGPTLVVNEGDQVNLNIKDKDGSFRWSETNHPSSKVIPFRVGQGDEASYTATLKTKGLQRRPLNRYFFTHFKFSVEKDSIHCKRVFLSSFSSPWLPPPPLLQIL